MLIIVLTISNANTQKRTATAETFIGRLCHIAKNIISASFTDQKDSEIKIFFQNIIIVKDFILSGRGLKQIIAM